MSAASGAVALGCAESRCSTASRISVSELRVSARSMAMRVGRNEGMALKSGEAAR